MQRQRTQGRHNASIYELASEVLRIGFPGPKGEIERWRETLRILIECKRGEEIG